MDILIQLEMECTQAPRKVTLKAKNNNNVEVQAIIDSVNFMQQGITDIKKSVNQDLEEVSNELVLLLDELEKINDKVA